MKRLLLAIVYIHFLFIQIYATIVPNPIISTGKPAYCSTGDASMLVDNLFGGTSMTITDSSWAAINIGDGYEQVFLVWNNPAYSWSDVIASGSSCQNGVVPPVEYLIQTSSNSTNGEDGDWETLLSVSDNDVSARGHLIDCNGAPWIRMYIVSGGGNINEIQIFDMSDGGTDSWFFPGTSITANAFKASIPEKNYADIVAENYPGFTPAVIRGGIPCMNSTSFADDIDLYLEKAGTVKYWAIEMGTNDAWGGSDYNAATFRTNLQTVITQCKANGIEPIIARMIGTNEEAAGWQVNEAFLTAIDELTEENNLIEGPDLYTYFSSHPDQLTSDGVHPNDSGAASIQRMWAEKMVSIYTDSTVSPTRIAITPSELSISEGNDTNLSATVYPLNATDRSVIWHSEDESIAVVDSNGLVSALAIGSAQIIGYTSNLQYSDTCFVNVVKDTVIEEYTLDVSVMGMGQVTIDPELETYTEDMEVTLTATPEEGSEFLGWDGDASGTDLIYTLIMDDNKSIVASFTDYYSSCDSSTTISLPFSHDGEGAYCWETSDDISNINSWNMNVVEINGVDYTNKWANSLPEKIDGKYYIYYEALYSWAHVEIYSESLKSNSLASTHAHNQSNVQLFPNPFNHATHLEIPEDTEIIMVQIYTYGGKEVTRIIPDSSAKNIQLGQNLPRGMYILRITLNNAINNLLIYKQ